MMRIEIKPMSVNKAYYGKLHQTTEYKAWKKELTLKLKPIKLPEPPYEVSLTYGFSSKSSDIDNPTKPTLDMLAKKYGFNDKQIYRLILEREQVTKGQEYIKFEIEHYEH